MREITTADMQQDHFIDGSALAWEVLRRSSAYRVDVRANSHSLSHRSGVNILRAEPTAVPWGLRFSCPIRP